MSMIDLREKCMPHIKQPAGDSESDSGIMNLIWNKLASGQDDEIKCD